LPPPWVFLFIYNFINKKEVPLYDNPLSFTRALLKADQVIFESYTDHKVYAAIVTLDADNNPVNFSSTICLE